MTPPCRSRPGWCLMWSRRGRLASLSQSGLPSLSAMSSTRASISRWPPTWAWRVKEFSIDNKCCRNYQFSSKFIFQKYSFPMMKCFWCNHGSHSDKLIMILFKENSTLWKFQPMKACLSHFHMCLPCFISGPLIGLLSTVMKQYTGRM